MEISLLADYTNEAPNIAKWYFDEWASNDPEATVEAITNKILLGANRNEVPILFLCHANRELVGAGEIKYRQLEAYPKFNYWLDGIYVIPSRRGKGISTKLIEFARQKAIELGISSLHLRCTSDNVRLYEARGFEVITNECEKFIMGLELST